jgi:hypothetical protein
MITFGGTNSMLPTLLCGCWARSVLRSSSG